MISKQGSYQKWIIWWDKSQTKADYRQKVDAQNTAQYFYSGEAFFLLSSTENDWRQPNPPCLLLSCRRTAILWRDAPHYGDIATATVHRRQPAMKYVQQIIHSYVMMAQYYGATEHVKLPSRPPSKGLPEHLPISCIWKLSYLSVCSHMQQEPCFPSSPLSYTTPQWVGNRRTWGIILSLHELNHCMKCKHRAFIGNSTVQRFAAPINIYGHKIWHGTEMVRWWWAPGIPRQFHEWLSSSDKLINHTQRSEARISVITASLMIQTAETQKNAWVPEEKVGRRSAIFERPLQPKPKKAPEFGGSLGSLHCAAPFAGTRSQHYDDHIGMKA